MNGKLRVWLRPVALALLLAGLLVLALVPIAGASGDSVSATTARPISEFIDAQGTYCIDDGGGGCFLIEPPLQNFLGFSDPVRDLAGAYDYAGIANQYIVDNGGTSLNTKVSGKIVETRRKDGRANVKVILITKNALTWVVDGVDYSGPLLFGHKVLDVMAGEEVALCNGRFEIRFINPAPGAPMPDLIQLAIAPEPGQVWTGASMTCNAKGPLTAAFGVPEGTPGKLHVGQRAKLVGGVLTFSKEDVLLRQR